MKGEGGSTAPCEPGGRWFDSNPQSFDHIVHPVPWSSGNDSWPTPRKRWFDSIRDYPPRYAKLVERRGLNPRGCPVRFRPWALTKRLGRQSADHLGLEPGMLWVRVPPEPLKSIRPRGAAWSARHPVTVEITGSNPVGDAGAGLRPEAGGCREFLPPASCPPAAPYANRQSGEAQTFVIAGSTPACATWAVFLTAACKPVVAKQVRWMTRGSIPSRPTAEHSARSSIGRTAAPQAVKAGSIPARVIEIDQVVKQVNTRLSEGRAEWLGSSTLPLVTERIVNDAGEPALNWAS